MVAAREQIAGGIMGLIILLSSYVILTTINPQLAIFNIEAPSIEKCDCSKPSDQLSEYCQRTCQKITFAGEEIPTYVEIPLGRIIERVMKKSEEARVVAERAKFASDKLVKLTGDLKDLTKSCDCKYSCPNCLGCPPNCAGGEGNCADYPGKFNCCVWRDSTHQDCGCTYDEPCPCTKCVMGSPSRPITPAVGSKLGIQTSFLHEDAWKFITNAQPTIVKLLAGWERATEIKTISPGTFIVGRIVGDEGLPSESAQEWFNRRRGIIENSPGIDCWEGYNEPGIWNDRDMQRYSEFESERTKLLAGIGVKACIGTFSEGHPDLKLWPYFFPAIRTALEYGGYLNIHEYDAPTMNSSGGWRTGRYKKIYNDYLIPANLKIPLIISETGIDGGIIGCKACGWKQYLEPNAYLNELIWYDSLLKEDDYVVGAAIFGLGMTSDWNDFELAPEMTDLLINYITGGMPGFEPPSCDVCPKRKQIIAKQNDILSHLSYYQRLRLELMIAKSNLARELFRLELAEALMRNSLTPPLNFDAFIAIEEKEVRTLRPWKDIDIRDDPLKNIRDRIIPGIPGNDGSEDPATFYVAEKGNEELIMILESIVGEGLNPPPSPCLSGEEKPHRICDGTNCISIDSCGASTCTTDSNCAAPPITCPPNKTRPYKFCDGTTCREINSCGVSTCASDGDCAMPSPTISLPKPIPPLYQKNPDWRYQSIDICPNPPVNIGGWGCGLTSLAMVSQYFGYQVTPDQFAPYLKTDITDKYGGWGVWEFLCSEGSIFQNLAKRVFDSGLTFQNIGSSLESVKNHLAAGHPIVASCQAYRGYHHLTTIYGMDDNYVYFQDPNWGKEYHPKEVVTGDFGCDVFYAFFQQ